MGLDTGVVRLDRKVWGFLVLEFGSQAQGLDNHLCSRMAVGTARGQQCIWGIIEIKGGWSGVEGMWHQCGGFCWRGSVISQKGGKGARVSNVHGQRREALRLL